MLFKYLQSLVYFPSVNFGLYRAEIFPWATFLAIFRVRKISRIDFFLIFFLILSSLYGAYVSGDIFETIRSLAAYINFFSAYFLAKVLTETEIISSVRLNRLIFLFLIALGMLQIFNLIPWLSSFLEFLVPRASSGALIEENRGVTLISTEPARAGVELIFIYFLFTLTIKRNFKVFLDLAMGFFLLLVIQSAMAFVLYLIYISLSYIKTSILIYIISGYLIVLIQSYEGGGRSLDLIRELTKVNFDEAAFILLNTGGHRVFSIWSSYNFGLFNVFGGGVGAWQNTSIQAINLTGYDISQLRYFQIYGGGGPVAIRSSGIVSNMMLDLGIFYSSIFLGSIVFYIKKTIKNLRPFWTVFPVVITFLVKILAVGSVGTPVEIFCFILYIRYIQVSHGARGMTNSTKENKIIAEN